MDNFNDIEFPHEITSLCTGFKLPNTKIEKWKKLIWLRPHEFLNEKKITLFGEDPMADDVIQSKLRDCYLLACLSSLALYPERVRKLIRPGPKEGQYIATLFYNGRFKEIIIDDYIPCLNDFYRPKFGRPRRHKLWAILIEKAYAKINRFYENLTFGKFSEGGMLFTGAPTYSLVHKSFSAETLAEAISHHLDSKYVMGALTPVIKEGGYINENGLMEGHFYSILGIIKLSNGNTYVDLRDPKGKFNWKNEIEFSNDLEKARLLRDELYSQKKAKDSFFMKTNDFFRAFNETAVTHVHDNFVFSFIKCRMNSNRFKMIEFTISKPCNGYISLSQPNKRRFIGNDVNYKGGFLGLQLYRKEKDGFTYIGGFKECYDLISYKFPKNMPSGDYILITHVNWENSRNSKIYITCYSSIPIKLRESAYSVKDINQFLKFSAIENGILWDMDSIGEFDIKIYDGINTNNSNFGSFCIVNNSKYTVVDLEVYFAKQVKGVKFLEPYEGSKIKLISLPKSTDVIPIEMFILNYKYKIEFNYTLTRHEPVLKRQIEEISDNELISIIIEYGSLKEILSKKNDKPIKMFVFIYRDIIYFLFKNDTSMKFKADFKFILEGLELVNPREKTNYNWLIELENLNYSIRKMIITSELFNFKYQVFEIE